MIRDVGGSRKCGGLAKEAFNALPRLQHDGPYAKRRWDILDEISEFRHGHLPELHFNRNATVRNSHESGLAWHGTLQVVKAIAVSRAALAYEPSTTFEKLRIQRQPAEVRPHDGQNNLLLG